MSDENESRHRTLQRIAQSVTGETMRNKTEQYYLRQIRDNIGRSTTEATGTDYRIGDPNLDTLAVNTSDGPVTVTIADEFKEAGARIRITDVTSNAATNNIVVTPESGTVDGNGDVTIDQDGGSAELEYVTGLLSGPKLTLTAGIGVSI